LFSFSLEKMLSSSTPTSKSRSLLCLFLLIYAADLSEVVMLLMMLLLSPQHRRRLVRPGLLARRLPPLLLLLARRDRPEPVRQVRDVLVAALRAQLVQRRLQAPQVVPVRAARAGAAVDVLGELLRVLRADKLVVVGGSDVDERLDGVLKSLVVGGRGRGRGRVEGRVVDRVPVDLADVEVLLDLGDALGRDAVGYAPDPVRGRVVVVGELLPVGARDQRDDAARGL
jgi:hypothetical protein